jgi:hypothetical protein
MAVMTITSIADKTVIFNINRIRRSAAADCALHGPHFRLQEWVADEKKYVADEGLIYGSRNSSARPDVPASSPSRAAAPPVHVSEPWLVSIWFGQRGIPRRSRELGAP